MALYALSAGGADAEIALPGGGILYFCNLPVDRDVPATNLPRLNSTPAGQIDSLIPEAKQSCQ